jgi:hypothetical protein
MEQTYNSQHRTIQNVVKCPNNLLCYKKNHIGSDNTLECLSENPQECMFSTGRKPRYFCQCPVRIFISKNFMM